MYSGDVVLGLLQRAHAAILQLQKRRAEAIRGLAQLQEYVGLNAKAPGETQLFLKGPLCCQ